MTIRELYNELVSFKPIINLCVDDPIVYTDRDWFQRINGFLVTNDIFDKDKDKVAELKEQYRAGGLGDVKIKRYLNEVLEAELGPIRARREEFAKDIPAVYAMLKEGSEKANEVANKTLEEVRRAIGVNYFDNI